MKVFVILIVVCLLFHNINGTTTAAKTKLLVVTGTAPGGFNSKHSEIIDLEEETYECSVEDHFPHFLKFASGGMYDKVPFLCGGGSGTTGGNTNIGQTACYYMDNYGEWIEDYAPLPKGRMTGDMGSTMLKNKLVVFGDIDRELTTFDLMQPAYNAEELTQTLYAMWGACTVPHDSETFMVIGGYMEGTSSAGRPVDFGDDVNAQRKETYYVGSSVTNGQNMTTGRVGHGCSQFILDGEQYIVVTGGKDSKRTTEIFGYDGTLLDLSKHSKFKMNILLHKNQYQSFNLDYLSSCY